MRTLPPIRIYTLGRLTVFSQDTPLVFTDNAYNRPLEMLRTFIALGGRSVSTAKLAQTLWPGKDIGVAKHSLQTNLYRLRKLLGDRCINLVGGELTMNADYCWIDVRDFENLLESDTGMTAVLRARRLIELYRGPFLDGCDMPSVFIQRERLHLKLLRVIGELGEALESGGEHKTAIECYRRGIEIDPLAEDLYGRLMRCYSNLGRGTEALMVYQRFRKMLTVLGIEPAPQTEQLHWEIQQGKQNRAFA
jgi:pentatricopeptide repeat protein